jgi:hypothetical protein
MEGGPEVIEMHRPVRVAMRGEMGSLLLRCNCFVEIGNVAQKLKPIL